MMSDEKLNAEIVSEADVARLVNTFYGKVRRDEILAPIFNSVIKDNWDRHLKIMTDFWSTILLYTKTYKSDPMPKHLPLQLESIHFERWLQLFKETIAELFEGQIALNAIKRASSIAMIMKAVKGIKE